MKSTLTYLEYCTIDCREANSLLADSYWPGKVSSVDKLWKTAGRPGHIRLYKKKGYPFASTPLYLVATRTQDRGSSFPHLGNTFPVCSVLSTLYPRPTYSLLDGRATPDSSISRVFTLDVVGSAQTLPPVTALSTALQIRKRTNREKKDSIFSRSSNTGALLKHRRKSRVVVLVRSVVFARFHTAEGLRHIEKG